MIFRLISRLVILIFGTLYPAYASFKVVKAKAGPIYIRWLRYWIVFAIFTCLEAVTDLVLPWFPFYYEMKMLFVLWLISPVTNGSSIIYLQFLQPMMRSKEPQIEVCIDRVREESCATLQVLSKKVVRCARDVLHAVRRGYSTAIVQSKSGDRRNIDSHLKIDKKNILALGHNLIREKISGKKIKLENW